MFFLHTISVDCAKSADLERDILSLMQCQAKTVECSARFFHPATLPGDQFLFAKGILTLSSAELGHKVVSLGPYGVVLQQLLKKDETTSEVFTHFHECSFQTDPLHMFAECGFVKKVEAPTQAFSLFTCAHDPRLLILSLKNTSLLLTKEDKEEAVTLDHYLVLLIRGTDEEELKTALKEEYNDYIKHLSKYKKPDHLKLLKYL